MCLRNVHPSHPLPPPGVVDSECRRRGGGHRLNRDPLQGDICLSFWVQGAVCKNGIQCDTAISMHYDNKHTIMYIYRENLDHVIVAYNVNVVISSLCLSHQVIK